MVKQAPSRARLLTMTLFAVSCFGLLLFLWTSFGGPLPLKAKGYRFDVAFPEAVSLAEQADVRISGVSVGRVVRLTRGRARTRATIELRPRYAPLPADSRAILRVKTLLGETFVALSPGDRGAAPVPDGGRLADRNVSTQVELDEVLRSFDPPTRRALHAWVGRMSAALDGRGRDLNDALGSLGPAVRGGAGVMAILDAQRDALRRLVADSGEVLGAIGSRERDVRTLVTAGDRLFAATARRERALSATIAALPALLVQARVTLRNAQGAAREAAPVVAELEPAADVLKPVLTDAVALAPQAEALFRRLTPVVDLSGRALPAATRLLARARPLVRALQPAGQELVPIVRYLAAQRDNVAADAANLPSVLQASTPTVPGGPPVHYLRAITYFSNEGFVGWRQRFASNRRIPYLRNRGLDDLRPGSWLKTYDCDNLGNPQPAPTPEPPPPCVRQAPFAAEFGGGAYPRLTRAQP